MDAYRGMLASVSGWRNTAWVHACDAYGLPASGSSISVPNQRGISRKLYPYLGNNARKDRAQSVRVCTPRETGTTWARNETNTKSNTCSILYLVKHINPDAVGSITMVAFMSGTTYFSTSKYCFYVDNMQVYSVHTY